MGGGKEIASARERVLSSMYGARERLFLLSAQLGRKVLPSAFFCFEKTAPNPNPLWYVTYTAYDR
jgi:hypothetical protein